MDEKELAVRLPSWEECRNMVRSGSSEPLHALIYENEPSGKLGDEWRDLLAKVIAAEAARIAKEAVEAEMVKLSDPNAVHINMLRGTIAKPSISQIMHIYPEISRNPDQA